MVTWRIFASLTGDLSRQATMNDRLTAEIERIRKDARIQDLQEANVKDVVIKPVLEALNWKMSNISEVWAEYPVPGGSVDYALRIDDRNKVFLEAKRPREELGSHQEQLLNYSFKEGVQLAVLTNGLAWWLYLPLREGSWEQRWFTTIDLRNEDVPQTATCLTDFLLKENVGSGVAVKNAESRLSRLRATRKIQETLPKAWAELVDGPDDMLVDLLDEKVAELCGEKAGREHIKRFLTTLPKFPSSQPPLPPKPDPPLPPKTGDEGPRISYTGKKPQSFIFQGQRYEGGNWIQMLVALSERMYRLHRVEFDKVLELKGKKRPYFSRNPAELVKSKPIGRTGFHLESNLSADGVVNVTHLLLAQFGYFPDELVIETT